MKLTPPVELVSPPDPAAWDALVEGSDTATVFHTSAWARLWIAEWPGARWEAVVLPDGAGYAGALGLIIHDGPFGRRVMAMPYGTYSGPIVRRGHPDPSGVRRLLLGGYAYAHLLSRGLAPRRQAALHLALLVAALSLLPITPDAGWKPTAAQAPVPRILLLLLASVGFQVLVLSSGAPTTPGCTGIRALCVRT